MNYKFAVFPGRFQFFHNGHFNLAHQGLKIAEKLIISVGSVKRACTIENPLDYERRVDMISSAFTKEERKRIEFIPIRDYYYNDNRWLGEVQQKTSEFISEGNATCLLAVYKDAKSSWNTAFPQWDRSSPKDILKINATDIRTEIFELGLKPELRNQGLEKWEITNPAWHGLLPEPVTKWVKQNFIGSERHEYLIEEYQSIKAYKGKWSTAPFVPSFLTADAVVFKSGHVLLVKRKFAPGKGLWALPGGFVNPTETARAAALRELKEETGIRVDKEILDAAITMKEEFDYPYRSLRGRTFTMAYKIDLGMGSLPEVRGSDDADRAFWVPYVDIYENSHQFFDDHFDIIDFFTASGRKQKLF